MKNSRFWALSGIIALAALPATAAGTNGSLVICRGQQCADVKYTMTAPYLFNTITDLFNKNIGKEILFCDADASSHRCFQPALIMDANSNTTLARLSIPSAEVLDAKPVQNQSVLAAILDFDVSANDTHPNCEAALANVIVKSADTVSMTVNGLKCAFTTTGASDMNMNFVVDYIDFDYGTIGAYYTLGSGQVMRGGKSGYALMRFTEKMPGTVFELNGLKQTQNQSQNTGTSTTKTVKTVTTTTSGTTQKTDKTQAVQKDTKPQDNCDCTKNPCANAVDMNARKAIEAAAKAEAEAEAAARKAVQAADAAARATTELAAQKAFEAEQAKLAAQAASEMARQARLRAEAKMAAMNGKPFSCADCAMQIKETTHIKQVAAGTSTNQGNNPNGVVAYPIPVNEPVMSGEWQTPVRQKEETFSEKWDRWTDKAVKVFYLEEPLF